MAYVRINLSNGNQLVVDEAELLRALPSRLLEQAINDGRQAMTQQAGNQQPSNDQLDLGTLAGVNKALGIVAASSQAQRQIYRVR
jgi:hypothetical protein